MAKTKYIELRRTVPYRPEHFDPDVLAPERARDNEGNPHSDKQHAAKVAEPQAEVVFYGGDDVDMVVKKIPAAKAKQLRAQLENGEISERHLSEMSYEDLGVEAP